MKTRTGFVSNSSSSSFVVIVTKEQIKNALETVEKTFGEEWRSFINNTFLNYSETVKFEGKDFVRSLGTYYTDGMEFPSDEGDYGEQEEKGWEVIKSFEKWLVH